jgi:type VI secretion system protein ImpD
MKADFLSAVLQATAARSKPGAADLDALLGAPHWTRALGVWIELAGLGERPTREALVASLTLAIAELDRSLSAQLNAVLHHPRFQALEASWRGLELLVGRVTARREVRIRVLSVTWRELARDFERAIEFDQSQLFRKVYSDEFGTPGGEPFSVLLGDYQIAHRPRPDQPVDDIGVLKGLAQVAAAAFAPFLTSLHPSLLGLDHFHELSRPLDLARLFQSQEYLRWNSLRESDDARFLGLLGPRVLVRAPWRDDPRRADRFRFREETGASDLTGCLWGNAVYAFGAVLLRAFESTGWLASIRGVERGVETGGLVTHLPALAFEPDSAPHAFVPPVDVVITDLQEKVFADQGLITACACQGSPYVAFYSTPSLHLPKGHTHEQARASSRLASMLQYTFCVSRFAHTIKMIGRDRAGSYTSADELEKLLDRWLRGYSVSNEDAAIEIQARQPLRDIAVSVREIPGKPGSYSSVIHLRPHFQLDELSTSLKLVTEIAGNR